jgi:hypothetical protein
MVECKENGKLEPVFLRSPRGKGEKEGKITVA